MRIPFRLCILCTSQNKDYVLSCYKKLQENLTHKKQKDIEAYDLCEEILYFQPFNCNFINDVYPIIQWIIQIA